MISKNTKTTMIVLSTLVLISCNHSNPADSSSNSAPDSVETLSIPDSLAVEFHITRKLTPKEREDFFKILYRKVVNYGDIASHIFRKPLDTNEEYKKRHNEFISSAKQDLLQHIDTIRDGCLPEYHNIHQDPNVTKPQEKQILETELTLSGLTCPINFSSNDKKITNFISETDEKSRVFYKIHHKENSILKEDFLKTQILKPQDIRKHSFNILANALTEFFKDNKVHSFTRMTLEGSEQSLNGQIWTFKAQGQYLIANKKVELVFSALVEYQGLQNELVWVAKSNLKSNSATENHVYLNKEEVLDPKIKKDFSSKNLFPFKIPN